MTTLLEFADGPITGHHHGQAVVRHFGRPDLEYRAATRSVAVVDRSSRSRLVLSGRAPVRMISGVVTNRVPPPPVAGKSGLLCGQEVYAAVLTPKGRMVSDLRMAWRGADAGAHGLWLHFPAAGHTALVAHLRKYLPPRFARVEDVGGATGTLTLIGPHAHGVLEAALALEPGTVFGLEADRHLLTATPPSGLLVVRTSEVRVPAFDLLGDRARLQEIAEEVVRAGAVPAGMSVFETLRVEAGRPEFGSDMDERTIPTEAGIDGRAIDHGKGCYTGQEVIVRIRDRGRVNRHLRGLLLGEAPAPPRETPLFREAQKKPMGWTTSAALSPAFGQTAALGFVRREIVPPAVVRLGDPMGPPVRVRTLGPGGWELQPADSA